MIARSDFRPRDLLLAYVPPWQCVASWAIVVTVSAGLAFALSDLVYTAIERTVDIALAGRG